MLVTEIMLFIAMFIFMRMSMHFAAAIMFMGMFIFARMSAAAGASFLMFVFMLVFVFVAHD